jgi:hypothetical protein
LRYHLVPCRAVRGHLWASLSEVVRIGCDGGRWPGRQDRAATSCIKPLVCSLWPVAPLMSSYESSAWLENQKTLGLPDHGQARSFPSCNQSAL